MSRVTSWFDRLRLITAEKPRRVERGKERMTEHLVVISSDSHAGAELYGYRPYLEKRWHEEFDAWAASYRNPWAFIDQSGDDELLLAGASASSALSWDSERRVQNMETEGIVGEVIFPNTATPFVPDSFLSAPRPQSRDEYERRWAGLKARNRWLADFCSEHPAQRAGVAEILLYDVDDAVEEVKAICAAGLRGGVVLPVDGGEDGLTPLYFTDYEPLWNVCEDLGVPVHRHARATGSPVSPRTGPGGVAIGVAEVSFWDYRALSHLIFSGVVERHPRLRFVFTETGVAWIVGELARLDAIYAQSRMDKKVLGGGAFLADALAELTMSPSEYFARNFWVGASLLTRSEIKVRDKVGVSRMMWGGDYPHSEGTFPYSRSAYQLLLGDLGDDEIRSILAGTAAELYDFDLGALQPIAERVGPTLEEIRCPITKLPSFPADTRAITFSDSEMLRAARGSMTDPQ
jgi:predicted TIM-barrel fold metal-dependent hydrolase